MDSSFELAGVLSAGVAFSQALFFGLQILQFSTRDENGRREAGIPWGIGETARQGGDNCSSQISDFGLR